MNESVLVIAPHPDDETLGCGGTLLRHVFQGDNVHWLIMSTIDEGVGYGRAYMQSRKKEIDKVAEAYGFASTRQADFITTKLDTYPKSDLVSEVSSYVSEVEPDVLYLPFRNDVHSDHTAVFDAVVACTKSFRYPSVRKVRCYETLSETEFSVRPGEAGFYPNLWVDISEYIERKIEIMCIYEGEFGVHPFPRSELTMKALSNYRGVVAGVMAAEAFMSIKEIV